MLRHYQMYLNTNDPEDAALIAILDRYVRSRRVGEFLRAACLAQIGRPAVVAAVSSSHVPAGIAAPVTAVTPVRSAAPLSVVEKARNAFFK